MDILRKHLWLWVIAGMMFVSLVISLIFLLINKCISRRGKHRLSQLHRGSEFTSMSNKYQETNIKAVVPALPPRTQFLTAEAQSYENLAEVPESEQVVIDREQDVADYEQDVADYEQDVADYEQIADYEQSTPDYVQGLPDYEQALPDYVKVEEEEEERILPSPPPYKEPDPAGDDASMEDYDDIGAEEACQSEEDYDDVA